VKRPKSVASSDRAIWIAYEYLKSKVFFSPDGTPFVISGGTTPSEVAKSSGMTRLESELALRLVVEQGHARRRKDGRYLYAEPPKQIVNVALAPSLTAQSSDPKKGNNS
jgi:hypothetical protein